MNLRERLLKAVADSPGNLILFTLATAILWGIFWGVIGGLTINSVESLNRDHWLIGWGVGSLIGGLLGTLREYENLGNAATLGDPKAAIEDYLKAAKKSPMAALESQAREILISLPQVAREFRLLERSHNATKSELKKKMYWAEMERIQFYLGMIEETFSDEARRLGKLTEDHAQPEESAVMVPNLPASVALESQLEDVVALVKGLDEGDELTLEGADPLVREFDSLGRQSRVLRMPPTAKVVGQ